MSEFIKIGILTVSDRASKGEYEDLGGPAILDVMSDFIEGQFQHDYRIVPDEESVIERNLTELCDQSNCCLVVTTGGTGPAPRDITPEVTEDEEPKKAEVKTSPVGEGLKNILNSIAGTTESIKNVLMGQQKADSDAAKDAAKDAEKSARAGQEKKLETKLFDGVKKVGEKVLKPVQGIFEKIWGFLKKVLLADIV